MSGGSVAEGASVRRFVTALELTLILILPYASYMVNETRGEGASSSYVLNGIIMPRILYPAFITPEGTMEVKVIPAQGAESWKAAISNEFGRYELKVDSSAMSQTENVVGLKLRAQQAASGLYSLELTALTVSGAVVTEYREPNSVCVRKSLDLPFRVMWITDTHIDDTAVLTLNFRRIVRLANFLRPDFILHTGDVVNMGKESLFPPAYNLIQDLEVPMIAAPGNHDHIVNGDFFTRYFAPRNGSLNVGPVHFVTLDTGPGSIDGELSGSQLAWLDRDLTANEHTKIKILMWHHPMFDVNSRRNDTVQSVYRIALKHDVNLILNGHMHEDIVFHGPILTLVNSNAYEGGRPYTGFRMLTISENGIEWHYAGGESQIPLYDLDIDYSQPNDGKTLGIVVDLANRWKITVNGVLRLRVGYGQFLKVEGATVTNVFNRTDYIILTIPITLAQGNAKRIVVQTKIDNQPPVVELEGSPKISEGPTVLLVEFRWRIFDLVLGVKSADVCYSTDNKTWTKAPLTQIEPRIFWARTQFEKPLGRIFYYAVASDIQGLGTTSSLFSITLTQPTSETPVQPIAITSALIPVLIAIAVIAVSFVYLQKRRTQKQTK